MDIIKILQMLNSCHGPSGDETAVANTIQALAAPFVDDCHMDTMGNLIAHKSGSGPKIMLAAHMDSIGMIITHIEEEGFLRFGKLGGLNLYALLHAPVRFANGVRGKIGVNENADMKKLSVEDLFLDIGVESREEARKLVCLGDTAVFDTETVLTNGRVMSPYLDNRISCAILLAVMEKLNSQNDVYFVFTTQEELGLRGAKTAAYAIDAEYALAIDVTLSDDIPGAKHSGSSVLGKGAAIKIMDQSVISHPKVVKMLNALAQANGIDYQEDVLRRGGTDAGTIQTSRTGVYTGGISVPCRYTHSPTEMVQLSDVEACIQLTRAFVCASLENEGL